MRDLEIREKGEGRRENVQTSKSLCYNRHCEASKKPWQSSFLDCDCCDGLEPTALGVIVSYKP